MCSVFLFAGCGRDYTYEEVTQEYASIIEQYKGTFFDQNENLSFSYGAELQSLIDSASPENQLSKLSKNLSSEQAVFEPVLRNGFEAVQFYINSTNVKTDKVPSSTFNSLYGKLEVLKGEFKSLKASKERLESIASGESANKLEQISNWLPKYQEEFHKTIVASNAFAMEYVYAYQDYMDEGLRKEGRLSPADVQLEYATKLVESADIYTKLILSQIENKVVTEDANFSKDTLQNFLDVKSIFKSEDFQYILTKNQTDAERDMMSAYDEIRGYNSLYKKNLNSVYSIIATQNLEQLWVESSEQSLSDEQKASLNKVTEFLETDWVIINNFLKNLSDEIKDWNE